MAKSRKNHPLTDEEITVTTIPESCYPGGEHAEEWQHAYADLLEAGGDEEAVAAAIARMRALGMEDLTGHIVSA